MAASNPYIDLYVSRKKVLFPLIEKYSGLSMKGKTHGDAVALYVKLLDTNQGFSNEVNAIINGNYRNSGGTIGNLALSLFPGTGTASTSGTASGSTVKVAGPIATIINAVGGVWQSITNKQTAKTEQDTLLYEAVLESQGKSDTGKILIISGVVLAFIGLGVFMVVKMKK